MKRFGLFAATVAALLTLSGCGAADSRPAIQPGETTEDSASFQLTYSGGDVWVTARFYRLDEEGEWEQGGYFSSLSSREVTGERKLDGTFLLTFQPDYTVEYNLKTGQHISNGGIPVEKVGPEAPPAEGFQEETAVWLTEKTEPEMGEETPVALYGYKEDGSMGSHELEDFFTPENLSDLDFAQAVTLEFTEEEPSISPED